MEPKLDLNYVKDADPCVDAREAIMANRIYFVGLVEVGRLIPGLEGYNELPGKYPVKIIEGSSDVLPEYEMERATQYAQIFNLTIVRRLSRK